MDNDEGDPSRREVICSAIVAGGAAGLGVSPLHADDSTQRPMPITLNVNGRDHRLNLDPRTTLLDALRHQLQLTGTKKGCDHGQCGACTVLINGRRVYSCLSFAVMQSGAQIKT